MRSARVVSTVMRMMLGASACERLANAPTMTTSKTLKRGINKGSLPKVNSLHSFETYDSEINLQAELHVALRTRTKDRV